MIINIYVENIDVYIQISFWKFMPFENFVLMIMINESK